MISGALNYQATRYFLHFLYFPTYAPLRRKRLSVLSLARITAAFASNTLSQNKLLTDKPLNQEPIQRENN